MGLLYPGHGACPEMWHRETLLEKTSFLFASVHLLQIVSWLRVGYHVHFSVLRTFCLNLVRSCTSFHSHCEFLCVLLLLCLRYLMVGPAAEDNTYLMEHEDCLTCFNIFFTTKITRGSATASSSSRPHPQSPWASICVCKRHSNTTKRKRRGRQTQQELAFHLNHCCPLEVGSPVCFTEKIGFRSGLNFFF